MPTTPAHWLWIALAVFLQGMNKGGLPAGVVALPLLVLIWPDQTQPARQAVGFLLPLLCVMDLFAMALYRRHVLWRRIVPLLPGVLLGVALASALVLSDSSRWIDVSDRVLRALIGILGLLFVLYRAFAVLLLGRIGPADHPSRRRTAACGLLAGITSTLAHAAGPVMQMYYLPQRLPKMNYAATLAGFFTVTNLLKVPFFVLHDRITPTTLRLNLWMLPVIPFGVLTGYRLVRRLDPRHYTAVIYALLAGASAVLTLQSFGVL